MGDSVTIGIAELFELVLVGIDLLLDIERSVACKDDEEVAFV